MNTNTKNTKEKYLELAEIKVKNLLSELYESESEFQNEIMMTREKMNKKISELEAEYKDTLKKRQELEGMFEDLKSAAKGQWESKQKDFELLLNYIEGDKESFIDKAEALIDELGVKIQEIEDKAADTAEDVKKDLKAKAKELKVSRSEIQERLDSIKEESGEQWREIKHWFIKKSKSIKEYISSS